MNRDQKAAVVEEMAEQLKTAEAVFAVDYRGITVAQVAELRTRLRDADARFRVVKNSLSERAADQAGVEALKPMLQGPTALTLVNGDAAVAAKALNDAARTLGLLEFKGGLLGGSALTPEDVRSIARLPSRDALNAQLVGTIAAPLSGLVRTLNQLIAGIAVQLGQIVNMDPPALVSGEAAPAAAEPEAPAAEPEAPAAEPEAPAAEPEAASETEPAATPDVQEAAEQPSDDPDSEPHDAPVQPDQAEGEDTPQED